MNKTIIETKRLILRELQEVHFEELAALLANKKVHKFFPKTLNRSEARDFLGKVRLRQNNDGISFRAVIRKRDATFLGIAGLLRQVIDGIAETEVGYRINDAFWGNGYGTEAAAGCIRYAKETLRVPSVISLILKENEPSIRVAVKNGLKWEKEALFAGKVHQVYRINLQNRPCDNFFLTSGVAKLPEQSSSDVVY